MYDDGRQFKTAKHQTHLLHPDPDTNPNADPNPNTDPNPTPPNSLADHPDLTINFSKLIFRSLI